MYRTPGEQIAPIADTAAELFDGRLFNSFDPMLRQLFASTNMEAQGKKLMEMSRPTRFGTREPFSLDHSTFHIEPGTGSVSAKFPRHKTVPGWAYGSMGVLGSSASSDHCK